MKGIQLSHHAPARTTLRAGSLFLAAAVLIISLPGCRIGGERSVEAENDRLRKENQSQREAIASLEGRIAEANVKLEALAKGRPMPLPEQAAAALPVATTMELERLSGLTPNDPRTPAAGAVAYVQLRDGRGRPLQAVGAIQIEVVQVPTGWSVQSGEPTGPVLTQAVLSPDAVRDAYRSGTFGTYYLVNLPFQTPLDRGVSVVIRARYDDALTGARLSAERLVAPRP